MTTMGGAATDPCSDDGIMSMTTTTAMLRMPTKRMLPPTLQSGSGGDESDDQEASPFDAVRRKIMK